MARIFDEKFENTGTPGYDESGWSESVGSGGTCDENETTVTPGSPSNWGSECLEIVMADYAVYTYCPIAASDEADTWTRIEIVVASDTQGNGAEDKLAFTWTNAWAFVWWIGLYRSGGSRYFRLHSWHDGSDNIYQALNAFSYNTRYRIEVKWDSTNNVWAWRIDGVDQPNDQDSTSPITSEGILSSTHPLGYRYICIGSNGDPWIDYTFYLDLVAVDDADWVGEEVGATTHYLEGSTDSVSLLSGVLNVTRSLSGTAISVSLLAGAISVTRSMVGAVNSVSSLPSYLNVLQKIIGSLNSISLLAGTLHLTKPLASVINSISLLAGDLDVITKHYLEGSADSVSLLSGVLDATRSLVGISNSISLLTAGLNIDIKLAGVINSISLLAGDLTVISGGTTHYLEGSADSVSLLSSAIILERQLTGSLNSVSLLSGNLTIVGAGPAYPWRRLRNKIISAGKGY